MAQSGWVAALGEVESTLEWLAPHRPARGTMESTVWQWALEVPLLWQASKWMPVSGGEEMKEGMLRSMLSMMVSHQATWGEKAGKSIAPAVVKPWTDVVLHPSAASLPDADVPAQPKLKSKVEPQVETEAEAGSVVVEECCCCCCCWRNQTEGDGPNTHR